MVFRKKYSTITEPSSPDQYIEFKAGKYLSDTELAKAARDAIKQIHDKKYATEMEYHGIKTIDLFGITFSDKHVSCEHEQLCL